MTLEATRTRWPTRKIWAAVEPRSNTMRRKIFEKVLPEALAVADAIVIGPVNRAQLLGEAERMSPQAIAEATTRLGKPAKAFDSTPELAEYLAVNAKAGDLVMIMSNGSFDGLSGKLLEKFRSVELAGP
jgi:UDP-N-acetylmuramate: L-alanyl-gamma-D-glutamyl-meso-diaminopimelate ligase